MSETIQTRALKNTITGLISLILTLSQALILVPVLLNSWGQERYGLWIAIFAIFNLLQTFDIGHQTYLQNNLNISYHQSILKFREILGSGLIAAVFLSCLQLVLCIILISSGLLYKIIGTTQEIVNKESLEVGLLSLMLMWVVFGSVGGILGRILIPLGKMVQFQKWGILMRLAQMLSLIIIAWFHGSILQACIFYIIIQSIITIFFFIYIKQNTKNIYPWWNFGSVKEGFKNLKKSFQLTTNNIAVHGSNNGLIIFIGNILHASVIPIFTTVRTLTNLATTITNLFLNSISPDISRFYATKQYSKIVNVFKINWLLTGVIVNIGFFILIPFIEKIYTYWTKGEIPFNSNLFYLLMASVSLINFGSGFQYFLNCSNNLKALSYITYSRLLCLFLITSILISQMGITAVGIGILFSEVTSSLILPYLFIINDFKKNKFETKLLAVLYPALASIIVMLFSLLSLFKLANQFVYYFMFFTLILIYIAEWLSLESELKACFKGFFHQIIKMNLYPKSI